MNKPSFEEFVQLYRDFRAGTNNEPPSEQEVSGWQIEWNSWSAKRRSKEIENIRTHCIIADVARNVGSK